MIIIVGGGGDGFGDEMKRSGGRGASVRGGGRRDDRCVTRSAVVNGKAQWLRGPHKRLESTRSNSLLCLPGPGGGWQRTLSVAKAEAKSEVAENSEEV